jgi:ABC-type spermidine/putrescine transport systems, ATPase components
LFLDIKNLSKRYDKKSAIENINIELEKGKILCILGPSGCGKSTILKSIGGFLNLDTGSIILDGKEISKLDAADREVATVFQSYALFPNMNVIENVSYGLKFRYKDKRKIRELALEMIEKVGLEGYEKKEISSLSGGEQQRVAFARSLVVRPKLLLLDEPFSNLDAKLRVQMQAQIKKLQREFDISMIFVTHDQAEAFSIADKIILMNKGNIIQVDTPIDLYNTPKDRFSLEFIGKANIYGDKYIRPEMIEILKDGEEAIVKNISFKGDIIDLAVDTKEVKGLKIQILNRKQNYNIGDKIYIKYEMEDLL